MNKKFSFFIIALVIIAAVAIWMFSRPTAEPAAELETGAKENQLAENSDYFEGLLQNSDDSARGNLMLVKNTGKKIYIDTARDFSSLEGREVIVRIDGTLESFILKDIESK